MKFLPDVLAFLATLLFIPMFRWEAGSMIWGFWLASFVLGTGITFTALVNNLVAEVRTAEDSLDWQAIAGHLFRLFLLPAYLLTYHLVLAVGIESVFPFSHRPIEVGPRTNELDTLEAIAESFRLYWPFLLAAFISRWREFRDAEIVVRSDGRQTNPSMSVMLDVGRINVLLVIVGLITSAGSDMRGILPYFAVMIFYLPLELFFRKRATAAQPGVPADGPRIRSARR